jgi:hypothetical protein
MSPLNAIIRRLREVERQFPTFDKIVNVMKKELRTEWEEIKPAEEGKFSKSFLNRMI